MAGPPTSVIYFDNSFTSMAKDLAARIRNDPRGIRTLLRAGEAFRDERDLEACQAVVLQASMPQANLIATCYEAFAQEVEIHYVDDAGRFLDPETLEPVEAALGPQEDQLGDHQQPAPEPAPQPQPDPAPTFQPPAPPDDPTPGADAPAPGGEAGGDAPEDPQAAQP